YSSSFFYTYLAYRDLHSFPTRRSSDLGARQQQCVGVEQRHAHVVHIAGLEVAIPHAVLAPEPGSSVRDHDGLRGPRGSRSEQQIDRKSTRLNSSHVKISYAVFCLKKKK